MRELASRLGVLPGVFHFHGVLHVALPYFYIPEPTKQNQLSVALRGKREQVGRDLESCHFTAKRLNVAAEDG